MTTVTVSDQIAASADKVWAVIGAFDTIHEWAPGIASVDATGAQVGATRACTTGDGAVINETLVSLDAAARSYTYKIDSSPLPLESYVSTISVSDDGDGMSTMNWTVDFEVAGAPEDEIVGMLKGMYQAAIDNVKQLTGSSASAAAE